MSLLEGATPAALAAASREFAARSAVLLALDFDGCLAPFVLDPEDARPLPEAREALHRLAAVPGTTLALVSGRPLETLRRLASPPPRTLLVGSHGAEFAGPGLDENDNNDQADVLDPAARQLLQRVTEALAAIVGRRPGTALELKPTAAVLHTRGADRRTARTATEEALAGPVTWDGVQAMQGKEVVELSVSDATKGAALLRLRAATGLAPGGGGVLYAGDDVTDERAFAVLDDDAGDVTVKVGDGETLARHRLPDPQAVARLLTELATLRER